MYIINNFAYGIDINDTFRNSAIGKKIVDMIMEYDITFDVPTSDPKNPFTMQSYYHGNSHSGYYPGVIGFDISNNDMNTFYWKDIKHANETFYEKLWNEIIPKIILNLEESFYEDDDLELKEMLIDFFKTTKPSFYEYETSS